LASGRPAGSAIIMPSSLITSITGDRVPTTGALMYWFIFTFLQYLAHLHKNVDASKIGKKEKKIILIL
jgi:hypothetical protein